MEGRLGCVETAPEELDAAELNRCLPNPASPCAAIPARLYLEPFLVDASLISLRATLFVYRIRKTSELARCKEFWVEAPRPL